MPAADTTTTIADDTPGNCIVAAASRLLNKVEDFNKKVDKHKLKRGTTTNSYRDVMKQFGAFFLQPCESEIGDGRYLLHTESRGDPHCIGLRIEGDSCKIFSRSETYATTTSLLWRLRGKSLDGPTMVIFRLLDNDPKLSTADDILLDLEAGMK